MGCMGRKQKQEERKLIRILLATILTLTAVSAHAQLRERSLTYDLSFGALGAGHEFEVTHHYGNDGNYTHTTYEFNRHFRFDDGEYIVEGKHSGAQDFSTNLGLTDYNNLRITGLQQAHREGWTGRGVNVRIIENTNPSPHQQQVTDIISQTAPGSTLSIFQLDYTYATQDSRDQVTNHSYGFALAPGDRNVNHNRLLEDTTRTFYNNNLTQGSNSLHVYAAGNSGATTRSYTNSKGMTITEPVFPGGTIEGNRYTLDSVTGSKVVYDEGLDTDRTIYVGALDSSNQLQSFSNSAGRAMNDYITVFAEGGTSFAAPKVTGAAALVVQKFNTSAANTKRILLTTADDLGAPGVDPVFGHGALNVTRALSPHGTLN